MNLLVKWRTIAGEKLKVVKFLLNVIGDHNPDIVASVTETRKFSRKFPTEWLTMEHQIKREI